MASVRKLEIFSEQYLFFATIGLAHSDDGPKLSTDQALSKAEFHSKFYCPCLLAEDLKKEISRRSSSLIVVCGPAGSGKSTAMFDAEHDCRKQPHTKVISINIRAEVSGINWLNQNQTLESQIRTLLVAELEKDYYFDLAQPKNRDDLLYFVLSPEQEVRAFRTSDSFRPTDQLSNRAGELFVLYSASKGEQISFKDWFYLKSKNFDRFQELRVLASELLDIPHFLQCSRFLNKYERVIIFLDNIDKLENYQQSELVRIVGEIQRTFISNAKIVVAVREENVYRLGTFNDNFNHPFISKVSFDDPEKTVSGLQSNDSINVPVLDLSNLDAIIYKRLFEAFNRTLPLIDKYRKEAIALNAKQSVSDLMRDGADWTTIYSISRKILSAFDNEKVIFLANNSILEFLMLHSRFLHYLVTDYVKQEPSASLADLQVHQITTIFLSWIHRVDDAFGMKSFNLFEEAKLKGPDCFLPYILLTSIWNKSISLKDKSSPGNNPAVDQILKQIKQDFGTKKKEIKKELFNLYRRPDGKGSMITFRSKQHVGSANEILNETTVRATYRGKATLGTVISSFGFTFDCAKRHLASFREEATTRELFDLIHTLITRHLEGLVWVRDNMSFAHKGSWFEEYLSKYGLPIDERFSRNSIKGTKIQGVAFERTIYISALLQSLEAYFSVRESRPEARLALELLKWANTSISLICEGNPMEFFDYETMKNTTLTPKIS